MRDHARRPLEVQKKIMDFTVTVISSLVHLSFSPSVLASSFPSKSQRTNFPFAHLTGLLFSRSWHHVTLNLDTVLIHVTLSLDTGTPLHSSILLETFTFTYRSIIEPPRHSPQHHVYLLHDYMCFALRGFYLIDPALSQNIWLSADF